MVLPLRLLIKDLLRRILLLIQDIPHLILAHLVLPLRFFFLLRRVDLHIAVITVLLELSLVDLALVVADFFVDLLDPLVHLVVTFRLFLAGLVVELPICNGELGLLAVLHWFGINLHGLLLFGLVVFDLAGFAGLAFQASPHLFLVPVISL